MAKVNIVCKNVFKNTEREKLKKQFNKRWIELINECEKNKSVLHSER